MRAANREGTWVPWSARHADTSVGREPGPIHYGWAGGSGKRRLGSVNVANARRQSMTIGQKTNCGVGLGLQLASGDGLGHRSDHGDPPGRMPHGQPATGVNGA